MKKGKKYLEAAKLVDRTKQYTKEEAIKLVKETSKTNFDSSVELALRLNLDTKKADQQLRGAIVLPNGTGKTKRVLVIAKGAQAEAAKAAGADYVGDTDMLEKIEKENWFEFDTMIATPEMMPGLGKIGRILGPKGLMPNPKTGTVTMDTKTAVEDVKKGRIEYRTDSYGNVHVIIGKTSFDDKKLLENLDAFIALINKTKPAVVKGKYILNINLEEKIVRYETEPIERLALNTVHTLLDQMVPLDYMIAIRFKYKQKNMFYIGNTVKETKTVKPAGITVKNPLDNIYWYANEKMDTLIDENGNVLEI